MGFESRQGQDMFSFHKRPVSMNVGPCHHGMARPGVADGGTASNMEGSCE